MSTFVGAVDQQSTPNDWSGTWGYEDTFPVQPNHALAACCMHAIYPACLLTNLTPYLDPAVKLPRPSCWMPAWALLLRSSWSSSIITSLHAADMTSTLCASTTNCNYLSTTTDQLQLPIFAPQ